MMYGSTVTRWVCAKCGAEMTLDANSHNPLRMFRPANACERFPHRWIKDAKEIEAPR